MRQIRLSVFETNSSSVHSMVIVKKEDYDKWLRGEVLMDTYFGGVHPLDTPHSEDDDVKTLEEYHSYLEDVCYEDYVKNFTAVTEDGKKQDYVIFGYHGYNG